MVWSSEKDHTICFHLHALIDGKQMVPDDVIDIFVLMLIYTLKKSPNVFRMTATITRPMALALSRQEHSACGMERMSGPAMENFHILELVLMPIIWNKHFHLFWTKLKMSTYTMTASANMFIIGM